MQNKVSKYPVDEEGLKKYLIEKEEVDEELWRKIQEKAREKGNDKKTAVILILNNYKKVPNEADNLLRNFASHEQPARVR